ncbi:MFS transporter [Reyranella sp. CPCC 100927]|uniref:MFS transporter n=1 Tax=Reyranella sp. CPCC 100927 TaxID=2599616 RepID=UPI0011B3A3B7|nr:MFS transporter [Reyranella sp. CPCC 100927]TWT09697.1 MFS transporter [Reyranella sp. CPCC 100927]
MSSPPSQVAAGSGASVIRNVFLLAVCQALAQSGNVLIISTTALAAQTLEGRDFYWTTLPVTLQHLGVMLSVFPAAMMGQRAGRAVGFGLGAVGGMLGGALCSLAIWLGSFPLLCIGGLAMGFAVANMQLYRFAATELAPPHYRAKAISYVTSSGVVAGIIGPAIARLTPELLPQQFLATYMGLIVLHVLAFGVLRLIEFPAVKVEQGGGPQRSMAEIATQPVYLVAVIAAMVSFGVMSFLMTATPLAIVACGIDGREAPITIFWHVMGMFVPAFFTGHLINRFGVLNIMMLGIVTLVAATVVDLAGIDVWNFRLGLLLVGVGWNFLFVGATALVTTAYRPSERGKAQALNDFLVFGTTATSSLLAGILQQAWGWNALNYLALPLVGIALLALLWLRLRPGAAAI